MKRILLYVTVFFVSFIFFACAELTNSSKYYYYNKSKLMSNENGNSDGDSIRDDIPEIIDVDEATDPFNPKNGEWNKIDYLFDGSKINAWFFHVNFDNDTVPTYTFYTPTPEEGTWQESNATKNEKKSSPKRTYAANSSVNVSNVIVLRYDGKNPLVDASKPYNAPGGRMSRFYFYRLTGTTAGLNLDQHLIAVDSYSKLIFAYGKITKTTSVLGNIMPTGFGSLDAFEADRGSTKGEKRPFYQYDPIGFVKENGEAVLYEEYRKEMGNSETGRTKYFPQVHNKERPVAQYKDTNSPGTSPYFSQQNAISANSFANSVSSKTYQWRNDVFYSYKNKDGQTIDVPHGKGFVFDTWSFDDTGKKLTLTRFDASNGSAVVTTEEYVIDDKQVMTDEKQAIYKKDGVSCVIRVEDNSIYKDAVKIGEYNYKDTGPDFLLRVKDATFISNNTTVSYVFSDDGGKVVITGRKNAGTYWYDPDKNTSGEGVSYSSSSTWGRMFLKNNDYTIEADIGGGDRYPANRQYGAINESDPRMQGFFTEVHGKVYQMRETIQHPKAGEINGWILNAYQFSADGKTITLIITDGTDYVDRITVKNYMFDSIVSLSEAKYKEEGTGTVYTIQIDGQNIKKDGVVAGSLGYDDPGPHILMRVAGWKFERDDSVYEFSADGCTLNMKWKGFIGPKSATYEWSEYYDPASGAQAMYGNYKVRLSEDDNVIEMATTGGIAALIFGYQADRKNKIN